MNGKFWQARGWKWSSWRATSNWKFYHALQKQAATSESQALEITGWLCNLTTGEIIPKTSWKLSKEQISSISILKEKMVSSSIFWSRRWIHTGKTARPHRADGRSLLFLVKIVLLFWSTSAMFQITREKQTNPGHWFYKNHLLPVDSTSTQSFLDFVDGYFDMNQIKHTVWKKRNPWLGTSLGVNGRLFFIPLWIITQARWLRISLIIHWLPKC